MFGNLFKKKSTCESCSRKFVVGSADDFRHSVFDLCTPCGKRLEKAAAAKKKFIREEREREALRKSYPMSSSYSPSETSRSDDWYTSPSSPVYESEPTRSSFSSGSGGDFGGGGASGSWSSSSDTCSSSSYDSSSSSSDSSSSSSCD